MAGGIAEFKTDNMPLFDFSVEEIKEGRYEVLELTRDLHSTDLEAKNVTTEYEDKFRTRGVPINYIKFVVGK